MTATRAILQLAIWRTLLHTIGSPNQWADWSQKKPKENVKTCPALYPKTVMLCINICTDLPAENKFRLD